MYGEKNGHSSLVDDLLIGCNGSRRYRPLFFCVASSVSETINAGTTRIREQQIMSKPRLNIIKPVMGFVHLGDGELLSRLNAVHDGMFNNPFYPNPPVDMASFKAAIDAYSSASAATLDGGKSATVARDKLRSDVIIKLRLLGHYVESACNNDMPTFVSSGFVPGSTARTPPQPVAVPFIVRVDQGNTGQLVVQLRAVANARIYELRYAPVSHSGTGTTWTTITLPSTKPPTAIGELTPGVIYTFQVRAFGRLGFSDWSHLVERMCT